MEKGKRIDKLRTKVGTDLFGRDIYIYNINDEPEPVTYEDMVQDAKELAEEFERRKAAGEPTTYAEMMAYNARLEAAERTQALAQAS